MPKGLYQNQDPALCSAFKCTRKGNGSGKAYNQMSRQHHWACSNEELGSLPTVHVKFEIPFQLVKWSGVGKPASSFKELYALTQKAELYIPTQLI